MIHSGFSIFTGTKTTNMTNRCFDGSQKMQPVSPKELKLLQTVLHGFKAKQSERVAKQECTALNKDKFFAMRVIFLAYHLAVLTLLFSNIDF